MNGKSLLLALCIVAAPWVAYGQSRVELYGIVDTYVGSIKRSDQSGAAAVVNGGGTYTSFWGLRGFEDLGGSMKALFVLESFFQPSTGAIGRNNTDPFLSKNAYVGVSGNFGELTGGRYTIPLLKATSATNPFGASLQLSPLMLQTWIPNYGRNVVGDSVWNNAARYVSPRMAGFEGTALFSFGQVPGTNGANNWSFSVEYRNGPLMAVVLNQSAKTGPGFPVGVSRQTTWMGGATYNAKWFTLYGSYYKTSTVGRDISDRTGQLGVSVPIGPTALISASWADSRIDTQGAANQRRDDYAVGYTYLLSVRTALYAIYLLDKIGGRGGASSVAFGMRHTF
ncbi:porin [Trinickia mobilis]|uniref:porin n=1 Tax=Trinickia mobilis TaxID=2816356 RepID=UPI001A903540|nr:porin [Trinickia mobilis]